MKTMFKLLAVLFLERSKMMKKFVIVAVLALALVALPLPAHAAGADTFHFRFTGQFAEAFLESFDPSGCIGTFVGVFAVDGRVKTGPGQPAAESVAQMFIDQFDFCNETSLISAFGFTTLSADEFQIDKKITSATLNTTIEVFDFVSGTSFPVEISVSWTGIGDTFSVKDRLHIKTPDFKVNSRFDGTFRNAEASGTVSDGTTNFTPDPTVSADMGSVKQGEVAIVH